MADEDVVSRVRAALEEMGATSQMYDVDHMADRLASVLAGEPVEPAPSEASTETATDQQG